MSGNRFTKFTPQEFVSQYVPLPLDLLAKVGERKQSAIDTTKAKMDEYKSTLDVQAGVGFDEDASAREKYYLDKLEKARATLQNDKNPERAAEIMASIGSEFNQDKVIANAKASYKLNPETFKKMELINQGKAGGDFLDDQGNPLTYKTDPITGAITRSDGKNYSEFNPTIYGAYNKGDYEAFASGIVGKVKTERLQWGVDNGQEIITISDGNGGTKDVFRDKTTQNITEILDETTLARAVEPYVNSLELDKGLGKVSDESLIYRIKEGIYNDANGVVDIEKVKQDLIDYGMLGQIHNKKQTDKDTKLGEIKGGGAGDPANVFSNGSAYALQTTEEVSALNAEVNDAGDESKVATVQKMWQDSNGESFFPETPTLIQNAIDKPESFQRIIIPTVSAKIYDAKIRDLREGGKIDVDNLLQSEKDELRAEADMKAQELGLHYRDYQIIKKQVDDKYKRQGKDITSRRTSPSKGYEPTAFDMAIGAPIIADLPGLETNPDRIDYDKDLNAAVQDFWGNKNNTSTGIQLFDDLKKADLTTAASKEAYERDKILADALDQHSKAGDNVYYKGQKIEGVAGSMGDLFEGLAKETVAALKTNPNNATFNPTMIYPKFEIKNGVPTYTMMAEGQFEILDKDENLDKTFKKSSKTVSIEADEIIRQQFGQDALMQLQMKAFTQKELVLMPKGSSYVINMGGIKDPVQRGQLGSYEISGEIAVEDDKGDVKVITLAEYEKQTGINMTKGKTQADASKKIMDAALTISAYKNKDLNVSSKDYGLFQINDAANTEAEQKGLPGWNKYIEPAKMTADENLTYAAKKQEKYGWSHWSAWKYKDKPNPATGKTSNYNDYYDEISWIPTADKTKFAERVGAALRLDIEVIKKITNTFAPERWKEAIAVMMDESSANHDAVGQNH